MRQPNIVIIDYKVGNTFSVFNCIKSLGYRRVKISNNELDICRADALILPGVGAFSACMDNLRELYLDRILREAVFTFRIPILGVCVGMQLMANLSEEGGRHLGLGWIPGEVIKIKSKNNCRVPHVGWNNIRLIKNNPIFSRVSNEPHFYFDHSYHYDCDEKYILASCNYGGEITAAIAWENIYGVQFHPEISHVNGLKLFKGFFEAAIEC